MALRVPKVSLQVGTSDEGSIGELHGEALGLALMLLLTLDMMLGGDQGNGNMPGLMRYAFCGAASLALIAGSLLDKRVHAVFRSYRPVALAVALMVPGAACGISAGYMEESLLAALQLAGGVFNGLGVALLVFLWGISFARLESRDITLNAVLGIACGMAAYVGLRVILPERPWLHAAISLLQLLHLALLRSRVTDRLPQVEMRDNAYFAELNVKRGSFALMLLPAMFCIGLIIGNIIMHAGVILKPGTGLGALLCTGLVALGGCAALAANEAARKRDQSFGRAFRTTVPIIAILMPPMALSPSYELTADNYLLIVNLTIVAAMAWGYIASLAQGFRLSPVFLFGLGVGGTALGYVLAAPVNALATATVAQDLPSSVLALTVSLVALAVASSMLPKRDDLTSLVVLSYQPSELWAADCENEGAGAEGSEGAFAGAQTTGKTFATPGHDPQAMPKSHAGTPYEGQGQGPAAAGGAESDEVRKGRFVRRCECVADTYLLSRRETDVLFLLAKGRNVSYITKQLCISEGTAKTHVNHVYRKCGVHSRQELICLIDSFDA